MPIWEHKRSSSVILSYLPLWAVEGGEEIHRIAKVGIGILLLVLLVPFTAYAQNLNQELFEAAEEGDTATVKALIAKGADVSVKAKDGWTALMYAKKKGHTEIVQLLKQAGAKE